MTLLPCPSGSKRYVHTTVPPNFSVRENANVRPGSTTVTTGLFGHDGRCGTLLIALNRAPTAGPVAPSSHVQLKISGLNSGVRVTSETIA